MTSVRQPQGTADARLENLAAWTKQNQRKLTVGAVVLLVLAGGAWFAVSYHSRLESFARRELDQARVAAEAGNLPLAASDLSKIVANYGSTTAGEEAALLLAQVRLLQGQLPLAVSELQTFIAEGPKAQFRAPAHNLLGAALEQSGRFAEAGSAFEQGARASDYTFMALRLLLDAGRAYTLAGDTASAARVLKRVVNEYEGNPAAAEAQLRLAELGRLGG